MRVHQICASVLLAAWFGAATAIAADGWTTLPTAPYTLNNKQDAIAFTTARHGWYGNGTGTLYATQDGGDTWRDIWRNPGTYIRALAFADERTGFLGNVGIDRYAEGTDTSPLYMTQDGGTTWQPIVPSSGPQIAGICAIDILRVDGAVRAIRAGGRVGGPAAMMESFDQGATWRSRDMSSITGMILDIRFLDETTGFIAGSTEPEESRARARILKTSDGGENWRTVFESERTVDNNWKLAFPSARIGYATIMSYDAPEGEARGYVVKTEDGGEHWTRLTVTTDSNWVPFGITFLDDAHGFVGGSTGGYATHDGGQSWSKSDMGLAVNKFSLTTRDDGARQIVAIGAQLSRLVIPPALPPQR